MADTSDILLVAGAIGVLYLIHKNKQIQTPVHSVTPVTQTQITQPVITGGGGVIDSNVDIGGGITNPQIYTNSGYDIFDWLDAYARSTVQTYREQYPVAPEVITVEQ